MLTFLFLVPGNAVIWFSEHPHKPEYQRAEPTEPKGIPIPQVSPDDRLAEYTEWLAAFTAILAISTIFLWIATERAIRKGEISSERQLRAYISCRPFFVIAFSENQYAAARFEIDNIGQTPAKNVRALGKIDLITYPFVPGDTLPELEEATPAPLVLFPKKPFTTTTSANRKFSADEIAEIIAGTKRITVYGIVKYEDVFERRRWTRFCSTVTGPPEVLKKLCAAYEADDLQLSFEVAPMGNQAI